VLAMIMMIVMMMVTAVASWRRVPGLCIAGGIGLKLRAAAGAAKIIGPALVVGPMPRRRRIDIHAADRILPHIDFGLSVDVEIVRLAVTIAAVRVLVLGIRMGGHRFELFIETLWGYRKNLTYTPWRYKSRLMKQPTKASVLKRLSRIEGQVRGIAGMVDRDRYCVDIVTQVSAVRAALHKVEKEILRDHISHCVGEAFASGNEARPRDKLEELVDTISRMSR
jgi:DNA-binding FrmR family transcriptional regulator